MTRVSTGEGDVESVGRVVTLEGAILPESRGGVLGEIEGRRDVACTWRGENC